MMNGIYMVHREHLSPMALPSFWPRSEQSSQLIQRQNGRDLNVSRLRNVPATKDQGLSLKRRVHGEC
jgi:hypothetical protein